MSRFCILILLFKPDEIKRNKKGYPAYNKENMNLITYLEKESNEEVIIQALKLLRIPNVKRKPINENFKHKWIVSGVSISAEKKGEILFHNKEISFCTEDEPPRFIKMGEKTYKRFGETKRVRNFYMYREK